MPDKIGVSASPTNIALRAGETAEVTVELHNMGQTMDQLTLSIDGLDPSWYSVPVSSVALFPNDRDNLKIIIQPPKSDDTKAGPHPFKIYVASQESSLQIAATEISLEIKQMLDLNVDISPDEIVGRKGTFKLVVSNPGSSETTVELKGSDTYNKLKYKFIPNRLTIKGSSQAEAVLQVSQGWLAFLSGEKVFDIQIAAILPEELGKAGPETCPYCGKKLGPDPAGTRVLCPFCSRKLIAGAQTANAKLVQHAWLKIPWFSKTPVIETFNVNTDNKRDFTFTWSVKKTKQVTLDGEQVDLKGEKLVSPTEPKTYELAAVNKKKVVTRTIDVQPMPLPQPKTSDRIRATLSPSSLQAHAGMVPAMATLQVQNLSSIVDKFSIEILGIPETWYSRSASSIGLMPQTANDIQITFQPPKKQGVRSGEHPFAISVRSESSPDDAAVIVGKLQIAPAPEFKVEIRPFRVNCRRKGKFRTVVTNTGVTDINFNLEATDLEAGCKFKFDPYQNKLAAWGSTIIPVVVRTKRGSFIGENKPYDITITGKDSEGTPQKATAQMNHKPIFNSWGSFFRFVRIMLVLIVIIVGIILVIYWGGGLGKLISHSGDWWDNLKHGSRTPWGNSPMQ